MWRSRIKIVSMKDVTLLESSLRKEIWIRTLFAVLKVRESLEGESNEKRRYAVIKLLIEGDHDRLSLPLQRSLKFDQICGKYRCTTNGDMFIWNDIAIC